MTTPSSFGSKPTAIGGSAPQQAQTTFVPQVDTSKPFEPSVAPVFAPAVFQPAAAPMASTTGANMGYQSTTIELPVNFPIKLTPQEEQSIKNGVQAFNIEKMTLLEVSTMCQGTEKALSDSFNPFLEAINKFQNPAIFKYMNTLTKEIKDSDFPKLISDMEKVELSTFDKVINFFRSKSADEIKHEMIQELMNTLGIKTKNMSQVIGKMETDVQKDLQNVMTQVQVLEQSKANYQSFMHQFALETAFVFNALKKCEAEYAQLQVTAADDTGRLREYNTKLQALNSRELTIEGIMTDIPAQQMAIKQIQEACILSLSEISSNMWQQFCKIKGTLIQLNANMILKDVQQGAAARDNLEANLNELNRRIGTENMKVASTMAGKNRLKQANSITETLQHVAMLEQISRDGEAQNKQNFQEAANILAMNRQEALRLGLITQPNRVPLK